MTISESNLAAIRYGYGHRPDAPSQDSANALLAQLSASDPLDENFPAPRTEDRISEYLAFQKVRRAFKKGDASEADEQAARLKIGKVVTEDFRAAIQRPVVSAAGFRERLNSFWYDHFTVSAKGRELAYILAAYQGEAIRPHIAGRFTDLLFAVVTHPAMLMYLDQQKSTGPSSVVGKRRGLGLNENLAREVLELHTLGVGAGYSQRDVTELAELFTGLRFTKKGFGFNPRFAEPGAETVLGARFGGDGRAKLSDIKAALHHIATRPETAQHLARKLAVHFVADTPDAGLVEQIAEAYQSSEGDLFAAYSAMLDHPRAWSAEFAKVKRPFDYVVSTFRVMGFDQAMLGGLNRKELRQGIQQPMEAMGERFARPPGPDGWPEAAEAWITPATLAARIEWVTELARRFAQDRDPRALLDVALGDAASANTRFVVGGAESKWEGVALVLASPEFNRR